MRVAKNLIPEDNESVRLASSKSLAMVSSNRLPIMKKTIPVLVFLAFSTALTLQAAPVSQIFEGVTVSNPDQPSALNAEFPPGTPWSLEVAWDNAAVPLSSSANQAGYRLTTLTITLEGTSGNWTTSAVMNAASFGLLQTTGYHEVQFTTGFDPANHTVQTIGTSDVYSVNLTLGDPTGTAVPALTPVPGSFDLADFGASVSLSNLKIYLNNEGTQSILGGLGDNPVGDPNLSVKDKSGTPLSSGAPLKFPATKVDGKGAKTSLTIANDGIGDLTGLAAKLSGPGKRDFSISFKGGTILAPAASRTLEIEFEPTRPGKRTATLKLTSNDPDSPVFEVILSGKGKGRKR